MSRPLMVNVVEGAAAAASRLEANVLLYETAEADLIAGLVLRAHRNKYFCNIAIKDTEGFYLRERISVGNT